MSIKIALAGNPNCGKTTLFNALTGSNQYVGNWPGVTVEKKEGFLKKREDVTIVDLPGIYSLSPYTLEEVVARDYLVDERPDAILNMIDGTNLERSLYLTTQLTELGIPVVIAINMMDVIRKSGDEINIEILSKKLGCKVTEISALKNEGIMEAAEEAIKAAQGTKTVPKHSFSGEVEHAIAHIEEAAVHDMPLEQQRWYAIKIFERDPRVLEKMNLSKITLSHIEEDIKAAELELDDDAESIIINERYNYIETAIRSCYKRKNAGKLTTSDKIDRIVTNRWLALPIFAAVMFIVYFISVSSVGAAVTNWAKDGVFGEGWYLLGNWIPGIPVIIENGLNAVGCAEWLKSLILDGIVGGVGSVLSFVPQMLILFLMLTFLESCGYMSRVAFLMDKLFRKFGLSGKSFIPILVGTGCGVPGIMASRTIENDRDRKMTIITTTFIPCGAKLPVIAMIASAMFGGAWWVAPSAYFIGILAIIMSGIILKKTKLFSGDEAPFVMELPSYHMPTLGNLLNSVWERGWSFIKKAGTVILLSAVVLWLMQNLGIEGGRFGIVSDLNNSVLAMIGGFIAPIFAPLGWGHWEGAVASITGLIAKENIVSTFGVLQGGAGAVAEGGTALWGYLGHLFTPLSAYSFLVFNLLCAPCVAAMGAIRREMNDPKWTVFAISYQCVFAYGISLIIYQLGMMISGSGSGAGIIAALAVAAFLIYMLLRSGYNSKSSRRDDKHAVAK